MIQRFHSRILTPTISESNCSEHWTKKHKRRRLQYLHVDVMWLKERPKITLPCVVKLTRCAKRLMDDDNLRGALKAVRDRVADRLIPGLAPGRADGDPRIKWLYDQKKSKWDGVMIDIEY